MGTYLSKKLNSKNLNNQTVERLTVIARYKYDAMGLMDISFKENDVMYFVKQFDEWWFEVIKDKKQGLVPSNYVSIQDGRPESVEGWWEIERWEAEKILSQPDLLDGTYLIRPSKKKTGYIISVRKNDADKVVCNVKHFQIKVIKDQKGKTYSNNISQFTDFKILIENHRKHGIGTKKLLLTNPFINVTAPPIHSTNMVIKKENINFISELGKGSVGLIYKAIWGKSYIVTAKLIPITSTKREQFIDDIKVFNKLRHRKIVEVLGICTEPDNLPIILVCEYLQNGSLKDFLKSPEGAQINLLQMLEKSAEISEGMAYLESQKFTHCNLRTENILINFDMSVKVSDFGLRKLINDYTKDDDAIKWLAPEAASNQCFTTKSDVWSFGIVIFEILTWCKSPYPDIPANEVLDKVIAGFRMENPEFYFPEVRCPCEIYNLMLRCWDFNPELRPKFFQMKNEIDTMIVKDTFKYCYIDSSPSEYFNL